MPFGLAQLLLVSHLNRELGVPDAWLLLGDDVVFAVLGQIAFMPTLVLAARLCPPGLEGTLFAALMSIFNASRIVAGEAGALLTNALGVTENDFTNLGPLVALCTVSSLLPLPFAGMLDVAEPESSGAGGAVGEGAEGEAAAGSGSGEFSGGDDPGREDSGEE